jgi:hypothetical protein
VAASPLSDTLPIDGHVIGISRSKKPEQMDSRERAGSQVYGVAYAIVDDDRLREQNLDAEMRTLRHSASPTGTDSSEDISPCLYNCGKVFRKKHLRNKHHKVHDPPHHSALQMDPSRTTWSKATSISGHVQQQHRTRDATILSLPRAGPSQPSSPRSSALSLMSREAPSRECKGFNRKDNFQRHIARTEYQAVPPSRVYSRSSIIRGEVRDESSSPSVSPVTSTRGASTHHSATGIVYAPRSTTILSTQAVGGGDHSLFKPGHQSYGWSELLQRRLTRHVRCTYCGLEATQNRVQPSPTSFSSVISTRRAQQYHFVNYQMAFAPESPSSAEGVGGIGHLLPVVRHSGDSPGTLMGWRVSSGSKLAGQQAQMCLGMVYFFALLRATPQGKKMSAMFLSAVLAAALFLLSLYGFVLR